MPLHAVHERSAGTMVLIRHGSTEWSKSGRHTGRTDLPLDSDGRREAGELEIRLLGCGLVAAYSSPLQRARMTAELGGIEELVVVPELVEWDYGDYEGLTTAEIRKERPDWSLWTDGCPNGEWAADVGRRADEVLAFIADRSSPDDAVGIFGHGHMLRVLAARWVGLAPEQGYLFRLDTTSLSVLDREHGIEVIAAWNT